MELTSLNVLRERALDLLPQVLGSTVVESIAFQGGIGRGWVDDLSDVDLLLCFNTSETEMLSPHGEQQVGGISWSIFTLCFTKVNPRRWSDKQRYIYGYETDIVRDPHGRLARLCLDAHLTEDEQRDRIVYAIKKLGNRGIVYRGQVGARWRGVDWRDRPDLWIKRDDTYSAQMRLNQIQELLINLLFAVNAVPVPSDKWRYHRVAGLPWSPPGLTERLQSLAQLHAFDRTDFARRCEIAVGLLTDCADEAAGRGLLPEDFAAFYFPRFSKHSDDTI
jgi:hypothetical protein